MDNRAASRAGGRQSGGWTILSSAELSLPPTVLIRPNYREL
jgi:hypothetical protein